jgi:hypothetical protein
MQKTMIEMSKGMPYRSLLCKERNKETWKLCNNCSLRELYNRSLRELRRKVHLATRHVLLLNICKEWTTTAFLGTLLARVTFCYCAWLWQPAHWNHVHT